jgi:hypothetical protein
LVTAAVTVIHESLRLTVLPDRILLLFFLLVVPLVMLSASIIIAISQRQNFAWL